LEPSRKPFDPHSYHKVYCGKTLVNYAPSRIGPYCQPGVAPYWPKYERVRKIPLFGEAWRITDASSDMSFFLAVSQQCSIPKRKPGKSTFLRLAHSIVLSSNEGG
jgi:hypothetical protein